MFQKTEFNVAILMSQMNGLLVAETLGLGTSDYCVNSNSKFTLISNVCCVWIMLERWMSVHFVSELNKKERDKKQKTNKEL